MQTQIKIHFESINGDSKYQWVNIDCNDKRVGKARIKRIYSKTIIKTINIFPEYERNGFAKMTIEMFKERSREIIAENVRYTAKSFWSHLGFSDSHDGNYRWVNPKQAQTEIQNS
jgi:hypothetical protein